MSFEVYAELSKRQYMMIQNSEASIGVPYGVEMKNKEGSRGLFFYCESPEAMEELQDGLDESGIAWS